MTFNFVSVSVYNKIGKQFWSLVTVTRFGAAGKLGNLRVGDVVDVIQARKGMSLYVQAKFVIDTITRFTASAEQLMRIIRDTLDLSRIEFGRLELEPTRFSLSEGLATLEQLKPVQFQWTDGGNDLGLVAEDVAAVDPLLATYGERGDVQGVKYRQLTAVLVKALQEQHAEFAAFRAQVEREFAVLRAGCAKSAPPPPGVP